MHGLYSSLKILHISSVVDLYGTVLISEYIFMKFLFTEDRLMQRLLILAFLLCALQVVLNLGVVCPYLNTAAMKTHCSFQLEWEYDSNEASVPRISLSPSLCH